MVKCEVAWAAGFFDGEGCTSLHRAKVGGRIYDHVRVTVGQVNRETLERFRQAIGGRGRINGPYERGANNVGHKPIWRYQAHGDTALTVLKVLWPYLSKPKQEQANAVIHAINEKGGQDDAGE